MPPGRPAHTVVASSAPARKTAKPQRGAIGAKPTLTTCYALRTVAALARVGAARKAPSAEGVRRLIRARPPRRRWQA